MDTKIKSIVWLGSTKKDLVAFIIVVASLILQGWTINPLARALGIVKSGNGRGE